MTGHSIQILRIFAVAKGGIIIYNHGIIHDEVNNTTVV